MAEQPTHAPDPYPEDGLEPVRAQAHEPVGLPQKVTELQAREKELTERLQRLQADFDNHRRRTREESVAAVGRGKEALLRALLPPLDSLDRALAHHADEGLRLLSRQLADVLAGQGVSVIDPAPGDAFDAKTHEAVAQEAREGIASGAVAVVLERGYSVDGRVVRPARVVVAP